MALELERINYVPADISFAGKEFTAQTSIEDELGDEEDDNEQPIKWINILFLPFQFWWQTIILYIVCVKCFFGPMQSVLPFLTCSPVVRNYTFLTVLKISYEYVCDVVYLIDTFFYILHRQVAEEAMKREYLPKSVCLILIDILSLIPFFSLFVSVPLCKANNFWPNILNYTEMLIIYRVVTYFSLNTTHNFFKLLLGYTIMFVLVLNAATCFLLLFTFYGLCAKCARTVRWHFDWRAYNYRQLHRDKNYYLTMYIYGCQYVYSLMAHYFIDVVMARTFTEFVLSMLAMLLGYVLMIFIVLPKFFAENILRLRLIYTFHPRAKRIIEETKRRNDAPLACVGVEKFYNLIWKKRDGISKIPEVLLSMPSCMKIDIMLDLVWPVFYHSPTLRYTSQSFKRWLCLHITIKYKLPSERLFTGPHCYTDLYYIKSGIVQIISGDDSSAPVLSVNGGTIFGDISFFIPPIQRKITVHCLTFCQVYTIPRAKLLRALNLFPQDHVKVMKLVKDKLKHARELYEIKKRMKENDRPGDEGIAWLKRRWWEIAAVIQKWKNSGRHHGCVIPRDEEEYHCAKYIGQLVMCDERRLEDKSIFVREEFPFIFTPSSSFSSAWRRLVIFTIYFVLFIYPPNLVKLSIDKPGWFLYVSYVVDLIYAADVVISLMTVEESDEKMEDNLVTVMYQTIKNKFFILDLMSTFLFEKCIILIIGFQYTGIAPFNRLIKTYKIFRRHGKVWNKNRDPLMHIFFVLLLSIFCFIHYWPYIMFTAITTTNLKKKIMVHYHYGELCSKLFTKINLTSSTFKANSTRCSQPFIKFGIFDIAVGWLIQQINNEFSWFLSIHTLYDTFVVNAVSLFTIVFFIYHKMKIIATLYLRNVEKINYQNFVSTLRRHYIGMKVRPDLMKNLDLYLNCHWKYYHGSDILHPNLLKDEPYDIYWKFHGEIAEKIIGSSKAFKGADPALIRELAHHAKFLILPKKSLLASFGVQTDKVSWMFRGLLKSVYHNEEGEILRVFSPGGNVISMSSVFLNQSSVRTFTAVSDVEILYLNLEEFNQILNHFPDEKSYILKCKEECGPIFEEMFAVYFQKHRDYKKSLYSKYSVSSSSMTKSKQNVDRKWKCIFCLNMALKEFRSNPESKSIQCWMTFRVFVMLLSLVFRSYFYMSEEMGRKVLAVFIYSSDAVSIMDIIIKMFIPYYDERGLIISDIRKCVIHYLTRNFLADVVGTLLGIIDIVDVLIPVESVSKLFLENIFPYFHMYLLTGYFDYHADKPSANTTLLMMLKWFLVLIPISTAMIRILFWKCVSIDTDVTSIAGIEYTNISIKDKCWLANYFTIWERKPTTKNIHIILANSANAVLSFLLNLHIGKFQFTAFDYTIDIVLMRLFLTVLFWFMSCYYLTLLILQYRGDFMFEHGIGQLRRFLEEERIDKIIIERVLDYFSYWRKRTSGVNMKVLMNERVAVIFRQDLNFYLFRRTLVYTSNLLNGGKNLQRKLAYYTSEQCFLPGDEIAREMDLCKHVFIVHRGIVQLSKNGETIVILTKGSLFGQLTETNLRPIRVTARSINKADVLIILIKDFQQIINDDARSAIANDPDSKNDYISMKTQAYENPYNTIEYIIRGNKAIRFPFMKEVVRAEESVWYHRWLILALLVNPVLSTALAFLLITLTKDSTSVPVHLILVTDAIHFIHFVTEFFSMKLDVIEINNVSQCAYIYGRLEKLMDWRFYCDLISLFVPYLYYATKMHYGLVRLLRIHTVFMYYSLFCDNFKTRARSFVIKCTMFVLLIHALLCSFIFFSCRRHSGSKFPVRLFPIAENVTKTIDNTTWIPASEAETAGCHVTSIDFDVTLDGGRTIKTNGFLIPKSRGGDYLIALTYIIVSLTSTNSDMVLPVTTEDICFCIFTRILLYLTTLWISSYVISYVYTSYVEMYNFDFKVNKLLDYLKRNGVSKILRDSAKKYTKLLWYRTKGNWLPEITNQAPQCLREDILGALYMHHLLTPIVFQNLPHYFLRQLAVRLGRVVVFPGKTIVAEGDIKPCIYFIHEGEVERWHTDKNGDNRLSAVLTTNGYFGLGPGLFPKKPFEFSYCTRTVVDFVYLKYEAWRDLLDGYPDMKQQIYSAAKKLSKDLGVPTTARTQSATKLSQEKIEAPLSD